jgi:hypothetical protein
MPLPVGLDKVTLTGTYQAVDGTPLTGTVTFEGPSWVVDTSNNLVFTVNKTVTLSNGSFSVILVATDATGVVPNPFTYSVVENIEGQRTHRYTISLPKINPTADISDLISITDFL